MRVPTHGKSVIFLSLLVAISGLACSSDTAPTTKQLAVGFTDNQRTYDILHALIVQDADERDQPMCRSIGFDRLDDYWKHGGGWSKNGGQSLVAESDVLSAVDLPAARYDMYQQALGASNASRVSRCAEEGVTRILVGSNGLGISGCATTAEIRGDFEIPTLDSGASSEIVPLEDGWYLNKVCT